MCYMQDRPYGPNAMHLPRNAGALALRIEAESDRIGSRRGRAGRGGIGRRVKSWRDIDRCFAAGLDEEGRDADCQRGGAND